MMNKAPETHIVSAEAFRHRVGATWAGWPSGPHLSAIPYLSAQVSVGDAATTDLLVLTNTFNGLAGWVNPEHNRNYTGKLTYIQRLAVRLTGRVVGRVGTHTGGDLLIFRGEGFKPFPHPYKGGPTRVGAHTTHNPPSQRYSQSL